MSVLGRVCVIGLRHSFARRVFIGIATPPLVINCGACLLAFLLSVVASSSASAASFQGLSDLLGGAFSSRANSVSADGTTVIGAGNVDVTKTYSNGEAFRWTSATGMVGLGDFPDSNLNPNGRGSYALGVSSDGSIVVGSGSSPDAIPVQAFRWTDSTGIAGIGYLTAEPYSEAAAISADGSTIVGTGRSYEAFRWTQPTGMVGLGGLPGGDGSSGARAVSADGSVIAGGAKSALGNEPFVWTQATGMVGLGNLAGGTYLDASALGISPEGNVVVGFSNSSNAPSPLYEAFRWTQATGMVGLSDLPGGAFLSEAFATSSNGEVIVGYGTTDTGQAAFIWDSAYGMRNIQQVLIDLGSGSELTGWNLLNATGVSADGRTIVGYGTNPDGNTEAWIATVPEPSTFVLAVAALALSLAAAIARRAHGKGGRTAQAFEVWREDYLDQVAVAWVLACVFVRFLEDNHLIDECRLAGEGERRKLAEDTHELFFRQHPHDTDREYFQHVFHEIGKIPAAEDLFVEGKTPLWAVAPSGDMAMNLLKFWREIDAESGHLKRSFAVDSGDTRFLGDLYQELSEKAKKKYALLQTPVFVEEFILDRTLTPAISEFGLEQVRMIDPTCGSGHFLLGGFARLFDLWSKPDHTTGNSVTDAQRALDGVWGVDINPFAVAIARFRLIVAAVQVCGIKRLKQAPGWIIHLANGDSLLFGSRPGFGGERTAINQQMNLFEVPAIYAVEDRKTLQEILEQGYHVVVGNPPYIIVRDRIQNAAIRELYSSCGGKYSLGVPFTQRFWELSLQSGESKVGSGYVGLITTNSFMKREFGKKLIEDFLPKIDLTHVIDTSGAYIPGHGTPTVILLGRNRKPTEGSIRAVQGIKGEPSTPEDASQGLVWQSILKLLDRANSQSDFISTADVPRTTFSSHPWSIGGGGAAELKEQIDEAGSQTLSSFCDIGIGVVTLEDDAYHMPSDFVRRHDVPVDYQRGFVVGDILRDWVMVGTEPALFPHDRSTYRPAAYPILLKLLWPFKSGLSNRLWFRKTQIQRGMKWFEYGHISVEKFQTPLSIAFAFVATHNHFVLDRGGKVFKQSAPVIKLPAEATEDDHLALLGLLNSSTACFWMKQVFFPKGGDHVGQEGARVRRTWWDERYEFAATQMQHFPLPESRSLDLARRLDDLARRYACRLPESVARSAVPTSDNIIDSRNEAASIRGQMISLQEELDWHCYQLYGLVPDELRYTGDDLPKLTLGQRAFEIVMARQIAKGELESAWFERHGSKPITDIPTHWPPAYRKVVERRINVIETNKDITLIEKPEYKRRWNCEPWEEQEQRALKNWLLDRFETPKYRKGTKGSPELTTTAQMADVASADAEFQQVAALYRGRPDFNVAALVSELVEGEAVPFLPILRYKPAGLRKREVWEQTWDLQRKQDAGKDMGEIPVPPKYTSADFLKSDFWRLRGKLDVPKERWVSYPHCSTDSDPTLVVGWAGWNHLEQATALIAYYDARKREGWDAKRLTPLLGGLDQLMPWIHQWHPEIDPEFGETAGQSFQTMLEHDAHELGLTLEDIRNWTPPEKARKTPQGRKKKAEAEAAE